MCTTRVSNGEEADLESALALVAVPVKGQDLAFERLPVVAVQPLPVLGRERCLVVRRDGRLRLKQSAPRVKCHPRYTGRPAEGGFNSRVVAPYRASATRDSPLGHVNVQVDEHDSVHPRPRLQTLKMCAGSSAERVSGCSNGSILVTAACGWLRLPTWLSLLVPDRSHLYY